MAYKDHRWFTPTARLEAEILELYRTTREFYDEAEYREELDRYSAWYESVAQENRRELQKLRGDVNVLGWFCRKR